MSGIELVARLRELRVTIAVDGGQVRIEHAERLPSELADRLRQHKAELLAVLACAWCGVRNLRNFEAYPGVWYCSMPCWDAGDAEARRRNLVDRR